MLISHPDFKPERKYEYWFVGETSGRYCQFLTDKELHVGSVVVIDDYLFSTLIYKISSIEEINEKKVVKFEDIEAVLGLQTLTKVDSL